METQLSTQENSIDNGKEFFETVALNFSARIVPVITNSALAEVETQMLVNIKETAKAIKAKKEQILAPFKKAIDQLNAVIKPAEDAIKKAEAESKQAILDFTNLQRRKAEEAARKQQEEENRIAEAKRKELADKAIDEELFGSDVVAQELKQQAQEVVAPKIGVVEIKLKGERTNKKFRVIDKKLVPEDYKIVNEVLIGQIVRGAKDIKDINIPGIEAYEERILAVGGK